MLLTDIGPAFTAIRQMTIHRGIDLGQFTLPARLPIAPKVLTERHRRG
jgi:hypothetical protein